jgi:hypothetical protein
MAAQFHFSGVPQWAQNLARPVFPFRQLGQVKVPAAGSRDRRAWRIIAIPAARQPASTSITIIVIGYTIGIDASFSFSRQGNIPRREARRI